MLCLAASLRLTILVLWRRLDAIHSTVLSFSSVGALNSTDWRALRGVQPTVCQLYYPNVNCQARGIAAAVDVQ